METDRIKKRARGFIFEQKCIPWFLLKRWKKSFFREKLYECRSIVFNVNNSKYWDKRWEKEINDIPDYRFYSNKFSKIISITPAQSRVLDVGCGLGILMERLLKEKDCKVVGVDISEAAVEYVKKKGMYAIAQKIPPLPFEDNSFDVAIATSLLEHCNKPLLIVREMMRVLKGSGMLVIAVPENVGPDVEREHVKRYVKKNLKQLVSKYTNEFRIMQINQGSDRHPALLMHAIKEKK